MVARSVAAAASAGLTSLSVVNESVRLTASSGDSAIACPVGPGALVGAVEGDGGALDVQGPAVVVEAAVVA
jgi:hypothetical protein